MILFSSLSSRIWVTKKALCECSEAKPKFLLLRTTEMALQLKLIPHISLFPMVPLNFVCSTQAQYFPFSHFEKRSVILSFAQGTVLTSSSDILSIAQTTGSLLDVASRGETICRSPIPSSTSPPLIETDKPRHTQGIRKRDRT